MSIKKQYTIDNFPCWAMSALINGDVSGLEPTDETLLDQFLEQFSDVVTWDYDVESLDSGDFRSYPLFGLATDCCTVYGYVSELN
jgi:hypothetical protein